MKISKLIEILSRGNPEDEVEILVHQSNRAYPIAYCKVDGDTLAESSGRIMVWLPDNMYTVEKK